MTSSLSNYFENLFLEWHADRSGLSIVFLNFINKVQDMDQNILFNRLIEFGYSPKFAIRTFEEIIEMRDIKFNWLNGHQVSEAFRAENAVYALLLILLGKKYDVGLTTVYNGSDFIARGDGGFDICVKAKDSNEVKMLIDVKSGVNTTNQHVAYLTEMNCPFYILTMDPDDTNPLIGTYTLQRDFRRVKKANLTLRHLLSNLACSVSDGLYNEELKQNKAGYERELYSICKKALWVPFCF